MISNLSSSGSLSKSRKLSKPSKQNRIAPAVYLVFPPARIFSAFSYITTDAPRSNAAMPAHIAAFPEPMIIILFVIQELFPKNFNN